MKVLRIGTMKNDFEVIEITEQPLESLQSLVDGYIEVCTPRMFQDCMLEFLADEMGRLKDKRINENLSMFGLVGSVVVVGVNVDDASEFDSLTDNQIMYVKRQLSRLHNALN